MNHGSVGRPCYKTLTKEPEDAGVCKPHTYIASHADVLSGCGAGTRDEPLLAVLFAECAYDMSGETAGGFFPSAFFLASCLRAFLHLFLQLRRSIFCPLNKQTACYALLCRLLVVGKRPKYLAAHQKKNTLHACILCSQASFLGNCN